MQQSKLIRRGSAVSDKEIALCGVSPISKKELDRIGEIQKEIKLIDKALNIVKGKISEKLVAKKKILLMELGFSSGDVRNIEQGSEGRQYKERTLADFFKMLYKNNNIRGKNNIQGMTPLEMMATCAKLDILTRPQYYADFPIIMIGVNLLLKEEGLIAYSEGEGILKRFYCSKISQRDKMLNKKVIKQLGMTGQK